MLSAPANAWTCYLRLTDNPCLHLQGIFTTLRQHLLQHTQEEGFQDLELAFHHIIVHLTPERERMVDIAQKAGISKQQISQWADALHAQGYIEKHLDPRDRRVHRLDLSERGQMMIHKAARWIEHLEQQWLTQMSHAQLARLKTLIRALFERLQIPLPGVYQYGHLKEEDLPIGLMLGALAQYAEEFLMQRSSNQGYALLRPTLLPLLINIRPSGSSIQQILQWSGLRKQSLSHLIHELDQHGYLQIETAAQDKRARVLFFSEAGWTMVQACHANLEALNQTLADLIGTLEAWELRQLLRRLYLICHPTMGDPLLHVWQQLYTQVPQDTWARLQEPGQTDLTPALRTLLAQFPAAEPPPSC